MWSSAEANRTALTLDAYLAARHLVVTPWNERQGCWTVSWSDRAIRGRWR